MKDVIWGALVAVLVLAHGQWQHSHGVAQGARMGVDLAIDLLNAIPKRDEIDWAPEYDQRRDI